MSIFSIKQNVGDIRRLRVILGVIFEAGGGVLIKKAQLKYLVPWKCRIHCFFHPPRSNQCLIKMSEGGAEFSPQILRAVLEKLGPTFIKLGQVLSMRADVVGEKISDELSKLQSNVPPFPYEEARRVILEELRATPEELFKSFEKEPSAAASLAQVHRAHLKNGKEVAVKIQRPYIRNTIEQDIHILFFLARLSERLLPEARAYQPIRLIKEFADWTMRELDFKVEGNNAERFRAAFKDNPHINIPTIFWKLTTMKILTMDFVHGVKADDVAGIRALHSDPKQLALTGVEAFFQQFLVDGFFHADPHPGNFFVMKNNMLCLHDFGMVGFLTPEQRQELASCFVAFEDRNIDNYLKHFLHLAATTEQSDLSGFRKDASEILSELFFTPNQPSIAWSFFHLINKGAERRLEFSADLALFGKAIITIEAMGLKLYPKFDLNKEMQPFVEQALQSYLDPAKTWQTFKTDIFDYVEFFKTLPEKTQRLLHKIDEGGMNVKIDATEILGIKTEFDRQNDVRILGAVTMMVMVLSAIFLYWEGKKDILGIPISSVGLIISAVLLVWFLVKVFKRPKT